MKRRLFARGIAAITLIALAVPAGSWLWGHRHQVLRKNFRTVERERIYAGAYQYPMPLKRIIGQYHIKTVLSLREAGDSYENNELKVLAEKGVQFRNVAIPFKVSDEERIAKIEEAVGIMTDPEYQPVFVHCWAGCHRAGIVVAIYRVSRCGWSEQAAHAELARFGGTSQEAYWPTRTLRTYCSIRQASVPSDPVTSRDRASGSERF